MVHKIYNQASQVANGRQHASSAAVYQNQMISLETQGLAKCSRKQKELKS